MHSSLVPARVGVRMGVELQSVANVDELQPVCVTTPCIQTKDPFGHKAEGRGAGDGMPGLAAVELAVNENVE